jgi:hypothetical protein
MGKKTSFFALRIDDILQPGDKVDIYTLFDSHKPVWVSGYTIFDTKTASKERHKRLGGKQIKNVFTGEMEDTYAIRGAGCFVFPVCRSNVRLSKPGIETYDPAKYCNKVQGGGVVVEGAVIDESDNKELEELELGYRGSSDD